MGNPLAVDNTALADATTSLYVASTAMRPPLLQIVTPPVLDPFESTDLFDLSYRDGASAYQLSSSPPRSAMGWRSGLFPFFRSLPSS